MYQIAWKIRDNEYIAQSGFFRTREDALKKIDELQMLDAEKGDEVEYIILYTRFEKI